MNKTNTNKDAAREAGRNQFVILAEGRGDYVNYIGADGEIRGGKKSEAIQYTADEAKECVESLGRGFSIESAMSEREERLQAELGSFPAADLDKAMCELNEGILTNLVSDAGYGSSPKSYINNNGGAVAWQQTLRQTVTDLVNSIFTMDGQLFDTMAEVEAAAEAE